jgi:hypothetical protein
LLHLLGLAAPGLGQSSSEDEARRHYERGLAFYEDTAYDSALGELLRAYELRPAPILLYNIALVHRALNDHAAALLALRQYVAASGKSLPEPRRAEVEGQIAELEQRVAQVTVRVDLAEAEILIDNRLVGSSPLSAPLLVNSGVRQLTVQRPGFSTQNRSLHLAGGDRVEQVIALSGAGRAAQAGHSGGVGPAAASPQRRLRGLAISWGITGAFTLSAIGCGIAALVSDHQLEQSRSSLGPDVDALHADADKTRRLALATDVLLGASLGAAAFSLWWTLRGADKFDARQRASLNLRLGVASLAFGAHY